MGRITADASRILQVRNSCLELDDCGDGWRTAGTFEQL